MDISVILCTYSRCQELSKALESLCALNVPETLSWEVLVVDNNSSDGTREVAEQYAVRYGGRFRYVFEGQQGKSYALNTGIREACGTVLAFMDDDVTVDSNWLVNLTSPLLSGRWVGVGGRVFPEREVAFPAWIERNSSFVVGPLVMFDLGPTPGALKEAPLGANMAFRKTLFQEYGGFRNDLGPCPGSELRGEDSEFVQRLMSAGEPLCYEPSAVVYHSVSEHRLTKKYFLAWWFDKGRSDVRTLGASLESGWSVLGIPVGSLRRLIVWLLRWTLAAKPGKRFAGKLTVWYLAGEILEFYRRGRKARESRVMPAMANTRVVWQPMPPSHPKVPRNSGPESLV
jgi:glucosyl-dolichyl phosphate glucuronosyltransferase